MNDAPVIASFDTALNYVENDVPLLLDADATVSDVDSADLGTGVLTVTLTTNGETADRVEIRNQGVAAGQIGVSGANVTFGGTTIGTFVGGSGVTPLVVTLNASATPVAVQALLQNLTYRNVSETPSTLPRTVTVALTDGDGGTSNVGTKTINVAAVNDAPVIAAFDAAIGYTEAAPAVLLDADATVADIDSVNLDTGALTITLTANSEAEDRVEIRNQGVAPGEIGLSVANVTFGGTIIGSFAGGVGGVPLVVTLNVNASPVAVEALLRNLTYRSVSVTPSVAARTVNVSLTDGDGGTSNIPTKTINVTVLP